MVIYYFRAEFGYIYQILSVRDHQHQNSTNSDQTALKNMVHLDEAHHGEHKDIRTFLIPRVNNSYNYANYPKRWRIIFPHHQSDPITTTTTKAVTYDV